MIKFKYNYYISNIIDFGVIMAKKKDDEKNYYVDNARLRECIIEYNRLNLDDKRRLVCFLFAET